MRMFEGDGPDGWQYVEEAAELLDDWVDQLFRLHDAALVFGQGEAERLGTDHPPGLCCGCTGAPMYAAALIQLLGRHVNGIVSLAIQHPGFVYPARTLARASLEHSARILWLLEPEYVPTQEARFLAAKAEEWRLYRETDPELEEPDWQAIASSALGAVEVPRIPGFRELMRMFTMPEAITEMAYREMSQATHGTIVGSMTLNQEVRERWTEAANVSEFLSAVFWRDVLELAALAVHDATRRFQSRLAPNFKVKKADLPRQVFDLMAKIPEPKAAEDPRAVPVLRPNRKTRRARQARARKRRG